MNFIKPLLLALLTGGGGGASAAPQPGRVQVAAYYFPGWQRSPGSTNRIFGDWTNLGNATPRFSGHEQPKHPVWGYEDEADPVVMTKKIDAASDHGLSSFIFCWYYHAQGPFIERALNEGYLRATNRTRLPFAIMWANHDLKSLGRIGAVSPEVFDQMTDLVVRDYFRRPEYWRVEGKCYFSIYEPLTFIKGMGGVRPARAALEAFRKKAARAGCGEIHLNLVDFQLVKEPDAQQAVRDLGADSVTGYVWIHTPAVWEQLKFPAADFTALRRAYFSSWDQLWSGGGKPHFPNVTMGWDTTPRLRPDQPHQGAGYPDTPVVTNNTPANFRAELEDAESRALKLPAGQRIVTIYAWNEWTEGGYLEPEQRTGNAYLEKIKEVFGSTANKLQQRIR